MTTMVTEVYDALLSAGADDTKARRAAEVLTDFDDRFDRIERQIQGLAGSMESNITLMRSRDALAAVSTR